MHSIKVLTLALGMAATAAAHASSMSYNINFSSPLSGVGLAPSGSYTLVLDPTKSVTADSTSGLTVNCLSFNGGTSGYVYNAVTDTLSIGGLSGGIGNLTAFTNDYVLTIKNLTTAPTVSQMSVVQSTFLTPLSFTASTQLNVSATPIAPPVAVTPEPSSLLLMATGLLGAGTVMRRRVLGV